MDPASKYVAQKILICEDLHTLSFFGELYEDIDDTHVNLEEHHTGQGLFHIFQEFTIDDMLHKGIFQRLLQHHSVHRQRDILQFLRDYMLEKDYAYNFRDICTDYAQFTLIVDVFKFMNQLGLWEIETICENEDITLDITLLTQGFQVDCNHKRKCNQFK